MYSSGASIVSWTTRVISAARRRFCSSVRPSRMSHWMMGMVSSCSSEKRRNLRGLRKQPEHPAGVQEHHALAERARGLAELGDQAEECLSRIDRVEDDALGPRELGDQGQLLGARLRVALADVAVDDLDVAVALERDRERVVADHLFHHAADDADEMRAVVAHVDAHDAPAAA